MNWKALFTIMEASPLTIVLRQGGPSAFDCQQRRNPALACRVGAGLAPDAPHGPVREQFTHTVRQRWSWETKDLAGNDSTRRHDCCYPSEHMHVLTVGQSALASLRQLSGSKSLLSFLSADVMPGIAFPRSAECYRGSLGPRFPTLPEWALTHSRGTVRCYDCLRPSRSVRLSLPSGTLG